MKLSRLAMLFWFKKALGQFVLLLVLAPFIMAAFPFATGATLLLVKVYMVSLTVTGVYLMFTSDYFKRTSAVGKQEVKKIIPTVSLALIAGCIGLAIASIAVYRSAPSFFGVLFVTATTVGAVKTCGVIGSIIGGMIGWVRGNRDGTSNRDGLI